MDYMDFVQVSSLFQAVALIVQPYFSLHHKDMLLWLFLQKHVDSGADISVACVPMDERSLTFAPCSL